MINFANNRLVNVDDVRYLGTVGTLDFSRNRLSHIGGDILNRTTTVQLLDLSYNRFVRVPGVITRASDVLIALRLDFNNISSLNSWVGPAVYRSDVEELSLRGNVIDKLPGNFMTAVRASLTQLDLRDNRLRTLPKQLFDDIPHLTRLLLAGNPLHCDCRLVWLRQLLSQVSIDSATCSSPSDVIGLSAVLFDADSCQNFTGDVTVAETEPPTSTIDHVSNATTVETPPGRRRTNNVALVLGLVIAGALLVVIIVTVFYIYRWRRRKQTFMTNEDTLEVTERTSDPPAYADDVADSKA